MGCIFRQFYETIFSSCARSSLKSQSETSIGASHGRTSVYHLAADVADLQHKVQRLNQASLQMGVKSCLLEAGMTIALPN